MWVVVDTVSACTVSDRRAYGHKSIISWTKECAGDCEDYGATGNWGLGTGGRGCLQSRVRARLPVSCALLFAQCIVHTVRSVQSAG